jgi:lipid II:glycine glycyltransferase (peptidoglycan interpeptide bridge formation enzyme)
MGSQREQQLCSGFTYAVDSVGEYEWNRMLELFGDVTINQTWAWCTVMSGNMSNLIVKHNGEIVAAAMLRLFVLPILGVGIAYISAGPMWRLRHNEEDQDILCHIARALRQEYAARRSLLLRISPNIFTNHCDHATLRSIFESEGFTRREKCGRTLFLPLDQSLDDIRLGFHRKWRACLRKAEQLNITIRKGKSDSLFKDLKCVYLEMLKRKQYMTDVDIEKYGQVYFTLPDFLRPIVILCEINNVPIAGIAVFTNGDTAVPWVFATGDMGIKCNASYLLQWELIKYLKECGCHNYDLGGCSPESNFNTYLFRYRMIGRNPVIHSQIGIMEACDSPTSHFLIRSHEWMNFCRLRLKQLWRSRLKQPKLEKGNVTEDD